MKKEFNQLEYIKNYDKEHYGKFSAKLKKEELKEINQFLAENNMNKREFILKTYKIEKLKDQVKKIISNFYISTEFSKEINLGSAKKEKLNNGIIISMYTFPILDDEKMLVVKIEFNNDILYVGTASYRYFSVIKKDLEQLDTSF